MFGFWARVWVLNEETFELERELQKKRASCKSTFFSSDIQLFQARGSRKFQRVVNQRVTYSGGISIDSYNFLIE